MIKTIKGHRGPRYQVRVYGPSNRRVCRTFDRREDAKNYEAEQKRQRSLGEFLQPRKGNLTFEEVSTEWLQQRILGRRRKGTEVRYVGILDNYLLPAFRSQETRRIRREDGERLVGDLIRRGDLHSTSIRKVLAVAKQINRFAMEMGYLRQDPFLGVRGPESSPKPDRYLSLAEIDALLTAAESFHASDIVTVALNSGMRLGEILGLQWDSIDLSLGHIIVRRIQTKEGIQESTKTNRIRYVPMNETLMALFKRLKALRTSENRIRSYVFTTESGVPYSASHFTNRIFQKMVLAAGIEALRFHDLRHTYASQFRMAGGEIHDLQKILGHSKIEQTMRYAHVSADHLKQAARLVEFSLRRRVMADGQNPATENEKARTSFESSGP